MRSLVLALCLFATASSASAQQPRRVIELSFHDDGTVTLAANHVTTRDILAEWARLCGCYVVNADRMTGAPLDTPMLFVALPQATVLKSLLRQTAGYVLTPRRAGSLGPSSYETIYIVPTSNTIAAPAFAGERQTPFRPIPLPSAGSPDDEIPAVTAITAEPVEDKPAGSGQRVDVVLPGMSVPAVRIEPVWPTQPQGNAAQPAPNAPGRATPAPAPVPPTPGR